MQLLPFCSCGTDVQWFLHLRCRGDWNILRYCWLWRRREQIESREFRQWKLVPERGLSLQLIDNDRYREIDESQGSIPGGQTDQNAFSAFGCVIGLKTIDGQTSVQLSTGHGFSKILSNEAVLLQDQMFSHPQNFFGVESTWTTDMKQCNKWNMIVIKFAFCVDFAGAVLIFLPGYDEIVSLREKIYEDKTFSDNVRYIKLWFFKVAYFQQSVCGLFKIMCVHYLRITIRRELCSQCSSSMAACNWDQRWRVYWQMFTFDVEDCSRFIPRCNLLIRKKCSKRLQLAPGKLWVRMRSSYDMKIKSERRNLLKRLPSASEKWK